MLHFLRVSIHHAIRRIRQRDRVFEHHLGLLPICDDEQIFKRYAIRDIHAGFAGTASKVRQIKVKSAQRQTRCFAKFVGLIHRGVLVANGRRVFGEANIVSEHRGRNGRNGREIKPGNTTQFACKIDDYTAIHLSINPRLPGHDTAVVLHGNRRVSFLRRIAASGFFTASLNLTKDILVW